jgi:hypothetical protein
MSSIRVSPSNGSSLSPTRLKPYNSWMTSTDRSTSSQRPTFSLSRSPTHYLGQSAAVCFTRLKVRSTCPISLPTYRRYIPSLTLLPRAFEISSHARIGVYDCLYVELAEREGCELVTADTRLMNSLMPFHAFIRSLDSVT